jgi:hypothetical protein
MIGDKTEKIVGTSGVNMRNHEVKKKKRRGRNIAYAPFLRYAGPHAKHRF